MLTHALLLCTKGSVCWPRVHGLRQRHKQSDDEGLRSNAVTECVLSTRRHWLCCAPLSSIPVYATKLTAMVYINDKKFACETCIKGHRSSHCGHTERPLYEIKKKGRPVSQCDNCRELRQSKKLHSRCTCVSKNGSKAQVQSNGPGDRRTKLRFVPIRPSLPNGLRDMMPKDSKQIASSSKQTVESLLNPVPADLAVNQPSSSLSGLATLAHVASLCDDDPFKPSSVSPSSQPFNPPDSDEKSYLPVFSQPERTKSCCGPQQARVPSSVKLPPLLTSTSSLSSAPMAPLTMPQFDRLASLAGTGCTCGFTCACPGCPEHRGADHPTVIARGGPNCRDCVDMSLVLEPLPTTSTSSCCAPTAESSTMPSVPLENRSFNQSSAGKTPSPQSTTFGANYDSDLASFLTTEYSHQYKSSEGMFVDEDEDEDMQPAPCCC